MPSSETTTTDASTRSDAVEKFCNRVAAEATVPAADIEALWRHHQQDDVPESTGGNFYYIQGNRVGKRFARAEPLLPVRASSPTPMHSA
jgi:hypothetical protein